MLFNLIFFGGIEWAALFVFVPLTWIVLRNPHLYLHSTRQRIVFVARSVVLLSFAYRLFQQAMNDPMPVIALGLVVAFSIMLGYFIHRDWHRFMEEK